MKCGRGQQLFSTCCSYKCAALDADNEDQNCEASTVSYVLPIGQPPQDDDSFYTACQSVNNGLKCATRACSCETFFISRALNLFFTGVPVPPTAKHSEGFDPNTECRSGNGQDGQRECCGYYPNRFPFNWETGRRCCFEKVYDSGQYQCCAGGEVKTSC